MNEGLFLPALVETALITVRGAFSKSAPTNPVAHLPLPSEYLDVLIVFGLLSLIPGRGQRIATMAGWGFVVATGLNMAGAFDGLAAKLATQNAKQNIITSTPGAAQNG